MKTSIAPAQALNSGLPSQKRAEKFLSQPLRRGLLNCGIISSLLYVAMNVAAAILYEGFN